MKLINKVKNYLGDYGPHNLDHKVYEVDVVSAGAPSGAALYEYCIEIIESKFPNKPELRILDLACGQGMFGAYAKKVKPSYIIDGIDIFVPEKEQMVKDKIYSQVIEADILKFDFERIKGRYDVVVSNQFFEHVRPEEAFVLLEKISQLGAAILISVPLPYHTFAYAKDYLLGSLLENTEFSDLLSMVTGAETHKTYFTKGQMRKFGFKAMPDPVFHSNFFYRAENLPPITTSLKVSDYYRNVVQQEIDNAWRRLIKRYNPNRPPLPKREKYEKRQVESLLMEPALYKATRKLIYVVSHPVRKIKKIIA